MSTLLKKQYTFTFPALNVHRRDEPVATDTFYSDTPVVDYGATITQVFVGAESLMTNVKRINSQVLLARLNGRVDGRMEEDLLEIIC